MLIPKEIKGKNKIRDLKICELYLSGMNALEIYDTFRNRSRPLTLRRIHQIISANSDFITPRIGWSKAKRIHRLQRIAEKMPDKLASSKDVLNVIEEIRKEIDGDTPLVDQSTHYHITKLGDNELIEAARKRGIALPASVAGRIGAQGQGESNQVVQP